VWIEKRHLLQDGRHLAGDGSVVEHIDRVTESGRGQAHVARIGRNSGPLRECQIEPVDEYPHVPTDWMMQCNRRGPARTLLARSGPTLTAGLGSRNTLYLERETAKTRPPGRSTGSFENQDAVAPPQQQTHRQ
jgi:hypothetical protein